MLDLSGRAYQCNLSPRKNLDMGTYFNSFRLFHLNVNVKYSYKGEILDKWEYLNIIVITHTWKKLSECVIFIFWKMFAGESSEMVIFNFFRTLLICFLD